jgi:hypothetical protein
MANLGPTTVFGDLIINGSIGGAVRVAYVKTTPTSTTVDVYLDIDITGEEANVVCSVIPNSGATNLDDATPTLTLGDVIFVVKMNDIWYCVNLFHPTV